MVAVLKPVVARLRKEPCIEGVKVGTKVLDDATMVGDVKILVPVSKLYEVAISSRNRNPCHIRLGTCPGVFTRNPQAKDAGVHLVVYEFVSIIAVLGMQITQVER